MKRFGTLIGILLFAILLIASSLLPSSCLSTDQRVRLAPLVIPLTSAAALLAEKQGVLTPGAAVTITQGTAIFLSTDDAQPRALALKELGLQEAIKQGVLNEGDRLVVDAAAAALVKLLPVEVPAPLPAAD